ncbi:hypothetical protein WDU94_008426 [Cyamophila willieti]
MSIPTDISNEMLYFLMLRGNCRDINYVRAALNRDKKIALTPLCTVVYANMIREVEILLNNGHDVDDQLENGRTPLFIAAEHGYTSMAALLIHKGANVNRKDDKGLTPLHLACFFRYLDIVKLLLSKNADVHADGLMGTPILSVTIWDRPPRARLNDKNLLDLLSVLIKYGANVNDKVGELSPLHFAVKENNVKVLDLLITNKVDVNASIYGIPLLTVAVEKESIDIIQAILKVDNLDLNLRDESMYTPLHRACRMGNLKIVKLLVDRGFDVNAQTENQFTPLLEAIESRQYEVIEYLLQHEKINVNMTIQHDMPYEVLPLHLALYIFDYENDNQLVVRQRIVKSIIDKTDNLNAIGNLGTPMIYAALCKNIEIVDYLIKKGASVNTIFQVGTTNQMTALDVACDYRNNIKMVQLLLSHAAKINNPANVLTYQPLAIAIKRGNFQTAKELLEHGAQIDKEYVAQSTSHIKTCLNQMEMTERQKIDNLLKLNLEFLKNVRSNKYDEVKKNLAEGACVNVSSAKCGSALIYASWKQYEEIVDLLLDNGADVNFKSATGYTSLHMACRFHTDDVIARKLLRHGAFYNLGDEKKNKTPRKHAQEGQNDKLDKLLRLVDIIFQSVLKKKREIISKVVDIKNNDIDLFEVLKHVKNCEGEDLISLVRAGKDNCNINRKLISVLTAD